MIFRGGGRLLWKFSYGYGTKMLPIDIHLPRRVIEVIK